MEGVKRYVQGLECMEGSRGAGVINEGIKRWGWRGGGSRGAGIRNEGVKRCRGWRGGGSRGAGVGEEGGQEVQIMQDIIHTYPPDVLMDLRYLSVTS